MSGITDEHVIRLIKLIDDSDYSLDYDNDNAFKRAVRAFLLMAHKSGSSSAVSFLKSKANSGLFDVFEFYDCPPAEKLLSELEYFAENNEGIHFSSGFSQVCEWVRRIGAGGFEHVEERSTPTIEFLHIVNVHNVPLKELFDNIILTVRATVNTSRGAEPVRIAFGNDVVADFVSQAWVATVKEYANPEAFIRMPFEWQVEIMSNKLNSSYADKDESTDLDKH